MTIVLANHCACWCKLPRDGGAAGWKVELRFFHGSPIFIIILIVILFIILFVGRFISRSCTLSIDGLVLVYRELVVDHMLVSCSRRNRGASIDFALDDRFVPCNCFGQWLY